MNRIDRLNALRILLEGRRLITAQEIAAHFGLSLRTVYRDIASLQEAGIAIEGEAGLGYSLSRHAQLSPVTFQSAEALSLLLAVKVVDKHFDSYHTAVFASAIRKIRAALPLQEKDSLERLEKKIALSDFGIPRKAPLDPEALRPIQQALLTGSRLCLDYQASTRKHSETRTVQPIGILYYGGYWHLIAYCELREDYRDFRVDRILSLEDLGPHSRQDLLSLEDYMRTKARHEAPSSLSRSVIEIVIRISPKMYNLFERSRFRYGFVRQHSLDSGPDKGWIEAVCYYDDLEEFSRWLLGFTQDVTIVSPESLRTQHQALLREALALLT